MELILIALWGGALLFLIVALILIVLWGGALLFLIVAAHEDQ